MSGRVPTHPVIRGNYKGSLGRECRTTTAPALTIRASLSDSQGAGTYAARARGSETLKLFVE